MKVVVEVWLKLGIADPVGKELAKRANEKGIPILGIKTGKRFDLTVNTNSMKEATQTVKEACEKLLAHQTIERFEITELASES